MPNLIIVPIYPPDFNWAKQLLDSASSVENIALGFSNQDDANSFQHHFPYKPLISNIPATDLIGFVGKKKLDLLRQAYRDYEYVSIIDAECKFLQPVTPILEEIWNANCFLANHSVDGARIMKELSVACGFQYDDDLYPWFNCIPVFKTELLSNFFTWIDSKKEELNSHLHFEFLVFAMYCRYKLNMPWRVLEGSAWHGLVENGVEWNNPKNKHLINQVVWSTYQKDIEQHPNIKMLFHLDRYPIK